jgi:hypothetical protein
MIVIVLLAMFWGPTVIGLLFGPRPGRRSRRSARLPRFRRVAPAAVAPAPPAEADASAADEAAPEAAPEAVVLPADSLHWSALDDRQLMRYLASSAQ